MIQSWTPPLFGVTYPVMTDGHVEGLPELMYIWRHEADECWKLGLLLNGPDERETVVLTDPQLDGLLDKTERLLTFHQALMPEMDTAAREREIEAVQAEYTGVPRPQCHPGPQTARHTDPESLLHGECSDAQSRAEQKRNFEVWLDAHCLDDTDLNDPPEPEPES